MLGMKIAAHARILSALARKQEQQEWFFHRRWMVIDRSVIRVPVLPADMVKCRRCTGVIIECQVTG